MKLRYQKLIFFLTLGIMGLGMATFSFTADMPTESDEVFHQANNDNPTVSPITDKSDKAEISITMTPPIEPTMGMLENKLEKDQYPEISQLITDFLYAKFDSTSTYEEFVTNPRVLDPEQIAKKTEVIKEYDNIICYTKKGINEIDFIAYVVYDTELLMISTLVPNIDEYHIVYDSDESPLIYSDDFSDETKEYLNLMRNQEDVIELQEDTNRRFLEAVQSDSELKDFFDKIYIEDNH